MNWIKTNKELPKGNENLNYEQIDCLVVLNGRIQHLVWNCAHQCWDDADGDDYACDALKPTHWMLFPGLPAEDEFHEILLPKLTEDLYEAIINKWLKKTGDKIEKDEVILEIALDKANVTYHTPVAGVLEIMKEEGVTVQVGELIALVHAE